MMTDEEKATRREALGLDWFVRVASGVCPYCERDLEPYDPEKWDAPEKPDLFRVPAELLATACNHCASLFGPVAGGGGLSGLGSAARRAVRPFWSKAKRDRRAQRSAQRQARKRNRN